MNQDQIKNIYDLIQKGQFQIAVKQSTNLLNRIKSKFKDGNDNSLIQEIILQLISLRGLSYSRMGNIILAEDDINKVMKIKPLSEEIIIIIWHYYVINGSFLSNNSKLKELSNYLHDASSMNILSEQFEIDNLSLLYYLKEFDTMKICCNKYLKRNKNSYFLALNILTSFTIFQNQLYNNNQNNNKKEDVLLLLLVNKYLNENSNNNINLKLYERRIISMIYLIKLFIFRVNNEIKNYFNCINELATLINNLYPCINNEKISNLKNLMILQNFELSIKNNHENDYLINCKNTLIYLIKNFDNNSDFDWDNIRIIKLFIIKIFQENLKIKNSLFDNITTNVNSSLNLQNSQSTQITNSSSFQTQSTIASFYSNSSNNIYPLESDSYSNLLEQILSMININNEEEDDDDYYQGKNRLSLFLLTELKGRIILLELFVELLYCIKLNSNETSNYEFLYDNLLEEVNNEIIRLINSNNKNTVIDLKLVLHYYFNSNLCYNNKHIIVIILEDLLLLLKENIMEFHIKKNLDLEFFTSRIQIITIFNQFIPLLLIGDNNKKKFLDESLLLDINKVLLILKNNINEDIMNYFCKNNSLKSSYIRFMISISMYCLSITDDNIKDLEINPTGICIFVLSFLNNFIIDHKVDYIVNNLLSEILPILGSFSISHYIRNEILNIKRSQITTLNVYGNYLEMISCPFIDCMSDLIKNPEFSMDHLYSLKNKSLKDKSNFDFKNNTKTLLNSYYDIYNELRETCIESLRENSFSLENLFETCKITQEISKNYIIEMLFSFDFLNNIFSMFLASISLKKNDYLENILSLFNSYKPIIIHFFGCNIDNIMDNFDSCSIIKQDLSPIINYYTPIYKVDYSFNKVSEELFPKSLFNYSDNINIIELEKITSIPKFNIEILKFVNSLPKLRYILIQRLKIWLTPLLLFHDLISSKNRMDIKLFNSIIDSLKDYTLSSKYSNLFPDFDLKLLKDINLPLINFLFTIINVKFDSNSSQINKDDIEHLTNFINTQIREFFNENIIKTIDKIIQFNESNQLTYIMLQNLFERINSFIFGPSFIITLIQSWLISNCSKKQINTIYKNLANSHIKILQEMYDRFKILTNCFNGTVEIIEYHKLCELFNLNNYCHLKNQNFYLNTEKIINSQLLTLNNSLNILKFIINSLISSLK
ncbi:hypothetical protein [Cryptosporidium parvum Iowa II]|uniref:Uncharacterized protein n=2 Tax=Cryptosporidium parvum TaxID=5807 RepID=Q5CS41_CRYPI|nr:hypothetical protein [Cryptosporidium parvum Iowa II]EAK88180.1 hypothetical protein cgd5_330 [Cryptosporidium parvum Iowa II]QOY41466.1 Uncharacterized protein CPATCC_0022110 [Cryptosporidium parvum]WKS77687.1 hypothetical protein CPCDC_5g330 [Cryptosporidium sp. 43IA8]WRK32177.1 Uncharacterized protein cpbgf_500330 [Cryptosporidium parvum]|eukprot:QOY41466.1 hypothetical protein CPATCC_002022 [Cryptosporidium parvum]